MFPRSWTVFVQWTGLGRNNNLRSKFRVAGKHSSVGKKFGA